MEDSGSEEEIKGFNPFQKGRIYKKKEIVFDEDKRKEYLTGFRKRKQQRRQEAQRVIKEKEKQAKIDERKEKKSQLLELHKQHVEVTDALLDIQNADAEEDENDKNTAVYETADSTITATVSEFELPEEYKKVDPNNVKVKQIRRKLNHLTKQNRPIPIDVDSGNNKKAIRFDRGSNKKRKQSDGGVNRSRKHSDKKRKHSDSSDTKQKHSGAANNKKKKRK